MRHILIAYIHDVELRYLVVLHHSKGIDVPSTVIWFAEKVCAVPLRIGCYTSRSFSIENYRLLVDIAATKHGRLKLLIFALFRL